MMHYKLLGGMRVAELALGTMTFGTDWGWGADKDTARNIFDQYVEAGGNFIDTANNYTNGTSEAFVGDFITADRDFFVVATKYSLNKNPRDPNAGGNHRKNMMRAVEGSLRRLNTDYIDLYWLHIWDFTTPLDEVMRGLDDLVRSGKVLYVGISDTPAWIISSGQMLAELRGWSKFVGVQLEYSLARRGAERDLLPMAKHFDLGVLAWGLLAGGGLTGKYNTGTDEATRQKDVPQRIKDVATVVMEVAAQLGKSPAQVAINWVRQQQQRARIIPILGARRVEQMQSNLECLNFMLDEEHVVRLNTASKIDYGFPHDFASSNMVRSLIHGEMYPQLDNHREG
jgi:aryl-alcohol dehydrogenase-like predicted oxidoreductase